MKKCLLCDLSDTNLLDFDEKSFQNRYLKLLFQKERDFKYNNVKLFSYHTTCHKQITVLSKKYKDFFIFLYNQYKIILFWGRWNVITEHI